ncbi:MAG: metal ABC transporter substrate-binding protein [Lachnospiraceae bacterium]|nr:metal ABC transporter substrate-binding protein [Lachnospiraceae bacterium]
MKDQIRNIITAAIAIALTFSLTACGGAADIGVKTNNNAKPEQGAADGAAADGEEAGAAADGEEAGASTEKTVIKVGANITPHSEILEKAKPLLEQKGITLEIVELEDSITPNTGVIEGSLDANYFQHVPYLEQFNKENGSDLVSIGAIHYEPFGVYAGRTKDLAALPDGAVIAVPNNVTNEARALLLLDQEGIISLKEDAGINATVEDIAENPKNIEFEELAPEQLVAALLDVDAAVINGNYAIEGGLHVKDALAVEENDGLAATTYGNIIATSKDKENDEALKILVEVLQSDEISKYINDNYGGAVVPLN